MKKFYTFILFAMFAMFGLQSNAAVYVLGNTPFGNWNLSSALEMTQGEDGIYSLKMEGVGANCYFSIMLDNVSWDSQRGPAVKNSAPTGEWENANVAKSTWKTSMAGDYTILYNAETEQAKITIDNGEEPDRDGYFLIGAFNGWDENTQVPFVKDGDKYTLTYTFSGEFKIRDKSGDWFGGGHTFTAEAPSATLSGGDNFVIENEAEYTLTVENGVLTISGFGDSPQPEEGYFLIGEFNGWDQGSQVPFVKDGDKYTLTQTFSGEFKIRDAAGTWYGGGVTLTAENPSVELAAGENLKLENEAEYTLTIEEGKLTVSGFGDAPVDEFVGLVLRGSALADWSEILEFPFIMDEENNDIYEVIAEIPAGFEFKVVKMMSSTGDHWLGAESEGNFWVTEEQLGYGIPLFEGGEYQNLYFENGGKFSFSFDVNNEILTILNAEVGGDLNGDGNVNTGDVSTLYQALLDGSNDSKFDLNGDGNVNTGDVSILYMIILGTN